jgi:glycosyltransferase involved in cell wall biosynthesis
LFPRPPRPLALITVGSLGHLYKGQDVLVEAVACCARNGVDLRLAIAGDGKYRDKLAARSRLLGVTDRVSFLGHLAFGAAVRGELDQADLFVLPSRQEGLPRALLEAMARGLPAIGSTVGGFPELLPPQDLVPPNDALGLARKIEEVARDPIRLAHMSARNLGKAREYEETRLERKRKLFLERVRLETEQWSRATQLKTASAQADRRGSAAATGFVPRPGSR